MTLSYYTVCYIWDDDNKNVVYNNEMMVHWEVDSDQD